MSPNQLVCSWVEKSNYPKMPTFPDYYIILIPIRIPIGFLDRGIKNITLEFIWNSKYSRKLAKK